MTVTPIGLANIGWKYYLVWAALNASFVPMVYFFYPETKGLSLEQIDHIFLDKGHGWDCFTQGVKESINSPPDLGVTMGSTLAQQSGASRSTGTDDEEKGASETMERTA